MLSLSHCLAHAPIIHNQQGWHPHHGFRLFLLQYPVDPPQMCAPLQVIWYFYTLMAGFVLSLLPLIQEQSLVVLSHLGEFLLWWPFSFFCCSSLSSLSLFQPSPIFLASSCSKRSPGSSQDRSLLPAATWKSYWSPWLGGGKWGQRDKKARCKLADQTEGDKCIRLQLVSLICFGIMLEDKKWTWVLTADIILPMAELRYAQKKPANVDLKKDCVRWHGPVFYIILSAKEVLSDFSYSPHVSASRCTCQVRA